MIEHLNQINGFECGESKVHSIYFHQLKNRVEIRSNGKYLLNKIGVVSFWQ